VKTYSFKYDSDSVPSNKYPGYCTELLVQIVCSSRSKCECRVDAIVVFNPEKGMDEVAFSMLPEKERLYIKVRAEKLAEDNAYDVWLAAREAEVCRQLMTWMNK
jgi:hypothetical protein